MATSAKPATETKPAAKADTTPTPLAGAPSVNFRVLDTNATPFFDDDYVHGKFLTEKYKGVGSNFLVAAKGSWKLEAQKPSKEAKESSEAKVAPVEKPVTSGEVKLITRLSDKVVVESRFDQAGTVRFWSNFGRFDIGRQVNVTGKFKTNSTLDWVTAWVQGALSGNNYDYNVRLDKKRTGEFLVNEKLHLYKDQIHFHAHAKLSLSNFKLRRYNALLAYREKKFDIVAQHVSRVQETLDLGELNFAVYYRHHSKYQGAVKGSFLHWETDPNKKVQVTLGGIANVDDKNTAKAKIDLNANLALAWKHKWSKNLTATLSTAVNLKDPQSYIKDSKIPVPVGIQLEFSY
jgi:hypothetical protein